MELFIASLLKKRKDLASQFLCGFDPGSSIEVYLVILKNSHASIVQFVSEHFVNLRLNASLHRREFNR